MAASALLFFTGGGRIIASAQACAVGAGGDGFFCISCFFPKHLLQYIKNRRGKDSFSGLLRQMHVAGGSTLVCVYRVDWISTRQCVERLLLPGESGKKLPSPVASWGKRSAAMGKNSPVRLGFDAPVCGRFTLACAAGAAPPCWTTGSSHRRPRPHSCGSADRRPATGPGCRECRPSALPHSWYPCTR